MDVKQTWYYVKISVGTYLKKVIAGHRWLPLTLTGPMPTPISSDLPYLCTLDMAVAPETEKEIAALAESMGVNYRQLMEETIWEMVMCRLDVSFLTVKMMQYNAPPAKEHDMAAKNILQYLRATVDDGIYFWRKVPVKDLPVGTLPTP